MQREKLYNLHKAACFIVALFAFKIDKILSDQISTGRKRHFLVQDEFIFSHVILLSPDIFYLKKNKIYQEMQRQKPYNLYKIAYFSCILLVSKKSKILFDCPERNQFFLYEEKFLFFLSEIVNKLFFKNCRAFHIASCGIFYFSIQPIK